MSDQDPQKAPSGKEEGLGTKELRILENPFKCIPRSNNFRVYEGRMVATWAAVSRHSNTKEIRFEITSTSDCYAAETAERRCEEVKVSTSFKTKTAVKLMSVDLNTPEALKHKLQQVVNIRHQVGSIEKFDFSGMVYMLGRWLSALSFMPKASLEQLMDGAGRLTNSIDEESSGLVLHSGLYIASRVYDGEEGSSVFWVLVAAAFACNARVITDQESLDDNAGLMSGVALHAAILNAVRILGDVYVQADSGTVFAYSLVCGLHSLARVVPHSDEGGFIRDVMCQGIFPVPFGGLAAGMPGSENLPSLPFSRRRVLRYSAMVRIIDSWLLQSAAAVAHAAPLVLLDDGWHCPIVIVNPKAGNSADSAGLPNPSASAEGVSEYKTALAETEREIAANMKALHHKISPSYMHFFEKYCYCLAGMFGLPQKSELNDKFLTWPSLQLDAYFKDLGNRHILRNNKLVPYFWIEPTCILRRYHFDTLAEKNGWASYGAYEEKHEHEMFPEAKTEGEMGGGLYDYRIRFEGARKSPWIVALQGHWSEGLENIYFSTLEPEDLAMVALDPVDAFGKYLPVSDYLWKRGQSQMPHPGELLHLGRWVRLGLHSRDGGNGKRPAYYLPPERKIVEAKCTYTFSPLREVWNAGVQYEGSPRECVRNTRADGSISKACEFPLHINVAPSEGLSSEEATTDDPNNSTGETPTLWQQT